jgi:hypothetical protein
VIWHCRICQTTRLVLRIGLSVLPNLIQVATYVRGRLWRELSRTLDKSGAGRGVRICQSKPSQRAYTKSLMKLCDADLSEDLRGFANLIKSAP